MKDFAEALLKKVPHNVPEYAEAHRLLNFLGCFREIETGKCLRQVCCVNFWEEAVSSIDFCSKTIKKG